MVRPGFRRPVYVGQHVVVRVTVVPEQYASFYFACLESRYDFLSGNACRRGCAFCIRIGWERCTQKTAAQTQSTVPGVPHEIFVAVMNQSIIPRITLAESAWLRMSLTGLNADDLGIPRFWWMLHLCFRFVGSVFADKYIRTVLSNTHRAKSCSH